MKPRTLFQNVLNRPSRSVPPPLDVRSPTMLLVGHTGSSPHTGPIGRLRLCFNILTLFSHSLRDNTSLRNRSHTRTPLSGTVLTVREHFAQELFSQCESTSYIVRTPLSSVRTCVSGALIHITQWHLYQAIRQQHLSLHCSSYAVRGMALPSILSSDCPLDNLPKHQQWSTTLPPHFFDSLDRFEYPV